jgi:hypothetical protein
MAGTLVLTTLSDGTNSTSSTNCIQGSAKAWVNYKATSTQSIRASYNVSSVTYSGTGLYTVNFTNAFADTNYSVIGTTGGNNGASSSSSNATFRINSASGATYSTTAVQVSTGYQDGNLTDYLYVNVAVFR